MLQLEYGCNMLQKANLSLYLRSLCVELLYLCKNWWTLKLSSHSCLSAFVIGPFPFIREFFCHKPKRQYVLEWEEVTRGSSVPDLQKYRTRFFTQPSFSSIQDGVDVFFKTWLSQRRKCTKQFFNHYHMHYLH